MIESIDLAVIGGSGLYNLQGFEPARTMEVDTPFGKPSAPILVGSLENRQIAFLARHGIGHRLSPTEVPYRANIFALKTLGVERILSISACGSLREDYMPGSIVVPDQLHDTTSNRARSFFGEGFVVHLSAPDPFCQDLSSQLEDAVSSAGATVHRGGTFITIEGPRFSTKSESRVYRSWGMSIIGMTTSPEAFLAREAEMCYAVMAHVTDYDVWHLDAAPVTVETVIQTLDRNTRLAQDAIRLLLRGLRPERTCTCSKALEASFITHPDSVPSSTRRKLDPLIRKYFSA